MNLITNLLTIQNQMRVFHWQTQKKPGSFAQHQAFGTAYEDLDPLIDDFIEIFQGKNGAIMGKDGFTLRLMNLSDNFESVIDEYITFLRETVGQSLEPEYDSDLLNIRDEMMAVLNQTKYRLHMM
jgi:DNA-binding ferritin-like protein